MTALQPRRGRRPVHWRLLITVFAVVVAAAAVWLSHVEGPGWAAAVLIGAMAPLAVARGWNPPRRGYRISVLLLAAAVILRVVFDSRGGLAVGLILVGIGIGLSGFIFMTRLQYSPDADDPEVDT